MLLDFWAVWCGPCIASFPDLREWNEKYADKGLVMIGLTSYYNYDWDAKTDKATRTEAKVPAEKEQAMLVKFAAQHKLTHRLGIGSDYPFSKYYGVTGIPQVVVIDRDSIIRLVKVGSGEINAKAISDLLATLLGPGQIEQRASNSSNPSGPAPENTVTEATKPFQGTWSMATLEMSGTKTPSETVQTYQLVVEGNQFSVKRGENTSKMTLAIDPGKDPKTIDLISAREGNETILKGIYELKDDTLTICRGLTATTDRPTEFKTEKGSNTSLRSRLG